MSDRDILTRFGQLVHQHRKDRGLTQEQFAGRVGLTRGSISNIENGTQDPGVVGLVKFARLFGCTVAELADGIGSTPDSTAWLELAKRVTTSERSYEQLAARCWDGYDVVNGTRYRGIVEGLQIARDHHLSVIADLRAQEGVR